MMNPVKGGVRRRRVKNPILSSSGDDALIKYSATSIVYSTVGTTGSSVANRFYIPGYTGQIANSAGPGIVSAYSTGKFMPGTKIRWEPSVSFTTSGRVLVGFTDNPEIASIIEGLYALFVSTGLAADYAAYANAVRGLGSTISFPVWQETDVPFPTRIRRKRFDINRSIGVGVTDNLDRCMQTSMWAAFEGAPNTAGIALGNFHYHDVVNVEGITTIIT